MKTDKQLRNVVLNEEIVSRVSRRLKELVEGSFYGTVSLTFVDGRMVVLREERTLKPEELPE